MFPPEFHSSSEDGKASEPALRPPWDHKGLFSDLFYEKWMIQTGPDRMLNKDNSNLMYQSRFKSWFAHVYQYWLKCPLTRGMADVIQCLTWCFPPSLKCWWCTLFGLEGVHYTNSITSLSIGTNTHTGECGLGRGKRKKELEGWRLARIFWEKCVCVCVGERVNVCECVL